MKLYLYYKLNLLIKIFIIFFSMNTYANENTEDKVKKLTMELRCMTCQNQSVYDSEAEFSKDIKKIVKTKFAEGKSEREIKQFLVDRYGEYVLFKPLFNYKNLFLWAFPFILLVFSLFFIVSITRKK